MGDQALLIRLRLPAPELLDRLLHLVRRLEVVFWENLGVLEWTLGYDSVALHYDALAVEPRELLARAKAACFSQEDEAAPVGLDRRSAEDIVTIPVCYGGELGPDLEEVARGAGLSVEEAVHLHEGVVYRVAVIGFAPGFPYLEGLDARLATPRKATPRPYVAAGSVGIAGRQTGIYSFATPGGWQIIGRTPIRLFDAGLSSPSLLQPGDLVRFQRVTKEEYDDLLRA
jgi:inhibitor of KinA